MKAWIALVLRNYLLPPLLALLVQFLGKSLRFTRVNQHFETALLRQGQPLIYAFWHGRMLLLAYAYRHTQLPVVVSRSRDGELVSRVAQRLGYRTIRGSSSRGAFSVLRVLWRLLQEGQAVSIAPDGPRGPCYRVKAGIIGLAQKTGAAILPVSCSARQKVVLQSWDRFLIPFPWSRAVIVYGPPLLVPPDADAALREEKRQMLEERLVTLTTQADRYFCEEGGG
ncbi:MAG: DUF374 domain-containing protein [Nitrospinota bacterium]|nr:MAG: DUF374 domain-containing protein [Nitrospinota bacterium]